jgi:phospholipase C
MFIEPNFADIPPVKTADDDHPPADLAHGQAFLSRMCNLLWDRRRFGEILLVITYDEHGGFYDHVPPPGTPKGEPGTYAPLIAGGPTYLGVRVPTFVVSPHINKGTVDRTIFDHTSILKTILVHNRDRFSTKDLLSFGQRVNEAKDLSVLFDRENPRQPPAPIVLPARRTSASFSNIHGELGSVPDVTPTSPTSTAVRISGGTSGDVIITERTVPPPSGNVEARDYHAALARLLKPRKRG